MKASSDAHLRECSSWTQRWWIFLTAGTASPLARLAVGIEVNKIPESQMQKHVYTVRHRQVVNESSHARRYLVTDAERD